MENLEGKRWGDLNKGQEEELRCKAIPIDGITGEYPKQSGDCIVDFEGLECSINGKLVLGVEADILLIDNEAVFYNPFK